MGRKPSSLRSPRPPSGAEDVRPCEAPGCDQPGEYRAPRARDDLEHYFWFCLDHVRDYNRQWNYYAGLTPEQIEREIRAATTWWRPTWPFGVRGAASRMRGNGPRVRYSVFGMENWDRTEVYGAGTDGWRPRPGSEEERALAVFEMAPPVTREAIKARYKTLVKIHHPDANGGDKDAEERLKIINRAYSALIAAPDL